MHKKLPFWISYVSMPPKSNGIEGMSPSMLFFHQFFSEFISLISWMDVRKVFNIVFSNSTSLNFWCLPFTNSRFACPFCGKCVRSKENLKLHVRKHTGERPFVCLFCGRAFGGKSDLTRHLRIHTGERPYHCESCGKCFARADYLSKHLTTHVHNSTPRWNEGRRRRILQNR